MLYKTLLFLLITCCALPFSLQAQQRCEPPMQLVASREANIFSEQQEVDLGDAIAEQIQRNFRVIDDDEVTAHLRRIGERIVKHLPKTNLRFQFFLVELPEANAFVLPGGRIYVSRKLISFAQSEDELAGVIGHEIGHLVARQQTISMTRQFKEVLGVTQVTDRQDIFAKYNQLVENARRKPDAFRRGGNHEDKDQIVADQIGLFAVASAGYDPQAQAQMWDRFAETKGKTGSFFSDLFGTTKPESRRLREMIKGVGTLPAACVESRSSASSEEYKKWQALVINYNGLGRKEALHAVLSKRVLDPPLRGEITHLRFSPDGRYIIAQDDSGINVLSREPFTPLFRITAPEASQAQFTPDAQNIVFYNSDLRVEMWNIAEEKMSEVHEMVLRKKCIQTLLSPDGKTMACLDTDFTLNFIDVASGTPFFQKKNFYTPSGFDLFFKMLQAALIDEDFDADDINLVNMGFSTDGRYFAAGQRSVAIRMAGVAMENTALVFDLQTRAPVSLKDPIKKLIAGNFAFTGPDRLIAYNAEDPKKSALIALPNGEVLEQLLMFPGKLTPVTRGKYMLVRPVQQFPVGVMDMAKGNISKTNRTSAIDIYDQIVVSERLTGELGLYDAEKNELKVAVQLPSNQLGRLRTMAVSPDFKWLAVSERTRGAAWDTTTGKRLFLTRGFRGSHLMQDGTLIVDFPRFEKFERQLAQVNVNQPNAGSAQEIKEGRVRQYGQFLFLTKPAKKDGPYYEDVILEMQEASTLKSLWTKACSKEAPTVWVSAQNETMVLSWPVLAKAAQAEIKANSELSQRLKANKEKEGDYLLQILDARTGTAKGSLLVETGKGSFRISNVFAVNDWVVISDTQNRVLIYSLATGEKKGQMFGGSATVTPTSGLMCVENTSGQLTVYDLATMQKRDEFTFSHPVSLVRFSQDGKKLFVLTASQTAYTLDLSSLIAAAPPK